MNCSFRLFLLVALGLIFVKVSLCKAEGEFEKQLVTLVEGAHDVEQEELIEKVAKLREAYLAPENEKYRLEHGDLLKVLNGISAASQIDTNECWIDPMYDLTLAFETVQTLTELNKSAAFMDFMKQLANGKFEECRSSLGATFQASALSLGQKTKNDVDILIAAISNAKIFQDEYYPVNDDDEDEYNPKDEDFQHSFSEFIDIDDQFISGLVSFIRETRFGLKSEIPGKITESKEEFTARFQAYTDELCSPIEGMLAKFADIYYPFLGSGMAAQGDEFAKDWVTRVKLCKTLRSNLEEVSEKTRLAWLENSAQ